MKKILSVLVVLVLCVSMFSMLNVSAATAVDVSMGSVTGKIGDTVSVDLTLNSNPGFTTLGVNVSFDKTKLQLVSVTNKKVLTGFANTGIDSQINSANQTVPYLIVWQDNTASTNNTETGKLATFTFKVLDAADIGKNPVSVSFKNCYDFNMADVAATGHDGAVNVTTATEDGSATLEVVDNFTIPGDSVFIATDDTDYVTGEGVSASVLTNLNTSINTAAPGKVFASLWDVVLFTSDMEMVTLQGNVKVKIKIPSEVSSKYNNISLVSVDPGDPESEDFGPATAVTTTVENGYLVFTTNNFDNYYAFVGTAKPASSSTPSSSSKPSSSSTPSSSGTASTSSTSSTTSNPVTGDTTNAGLAMILLVVAAAGVVVAKKRVRA